MPATRSRTSTEQAAEVASEEVKQQPQEESEPAAIPVAEEAEAEAVPIVAPEATEAEAVPAVVEEPQDIVEPIVPVVAAEENGTSEAVAEANGTSAEAESVEEPIKRKSDVVVGGEGDGPDSTEPVVAKKAKVDEEEPVVAELPAEASA